MAALIHNATVLRERIAPDATMMAVVKANAYGHGVSKVVCALSGKVEMFGVANVTEACAVRQADSTTPVFILGPALPEERREIVERGFIPSVSDFAEAQAYAALGGDQPVVVHLVIDTGMGRIGIWEEDALDCVERIVALPRLEVRGISSHLPMPDEDAELAGHGGFWQLIEEAEKTRKRS